MDFEKARYDTHEKLIDRLEGLAHGDDLEALSSFAKAYLGLYLDLDNHLPPEQRVALLADADVIGGIWDGLHHCLYTEKLPSPAEVAQSVLDDARLPICYIAQAALDREYRIAGDLSGLDDGRLQSVISMYFIYRHDLENPWLPQLVQQRPKLVADAMLGLWRALQAMRSDKMPGFRHILTHDSYEPVLMEVALPVLAEFDGIPKNLVRELMFFAFANNDLQALQAIAQERVTRLAQMPIVHQVYWMGIAYLLDPEQYRDALLDFLGVTREKALPLLNFLVPLLQACPNRVRLEAATVAHLLHCLAPRFRPIKDRFGSPDDNAVKIIWLIELLGQYRDEAGRRALADLRKIRVMRLYNDYLDKIDPDQGGGNKLV